MTASSSDTIYLYENVGLERTLSSEAQEFVPLNVGVMQTLSPIANEYIVENAGVEVTTQKLAIEYTTESVDTSTPVPHLWHLYKPRGFVGDKVYLYGQGLGALQTTFQAHVDVDYGPDYSAGTDAPAAVFDWNVLPATADAYGDLREIYAGNDPAPPRTNVETEVVEITIPDSIVPTVAAGAQTDYIYLTHTGGVSNRLPWLVYPALPVPMTIAASQSRGGGQLRVVIDPVATTLIPEPNAHIVPEPYLVAGGRALAMPMLGAISKTTAHAKSWSVTADLDAALDRDFKADYRWVPDPAKLVARPDIGTGALTWKTSQGDSDNEWLMYSDSAGYIDPAYELETRMGDLEKPAFVLPGNAWMGLRFALPENSSFTLAFAAVLHVNSGPRATLVSSFRDAGEQLGHYPLSLNMSGPLMDLIVGGRFAKQGISSISGRAVIVCMAIEPTAGDFALGGGPVQHLPGSGRLLVMDRSPRGAAFSHPPMSANGQKLYLGRPQVLSNNPKSMNGTMRMDVLDVMLWKRMLSPKEQWAVANKLDGIYGVTGKMPIVNPGGPGGPPSIPFPVPTLPSGAIINRPNF